VRAILLRGTPLDAQPGDVLAMVAFLLVGLVVATRLFRKRLD